MGGRCIITTTLMLTPNVLHWGRPKAGEVGHGAREVKGEKLGRSEAERVCRG